MITQSLTFIAIAAGIVWLSVCNRRTRNHRRIFLRAHYSRPYRRYQDIDAVMTYDRHLWLLLTLRDPRPAYADYAYGADGEDAA